MGGSCTSLLVHLSAVHPYACMWIHFNRFLIYCKIPLVSSLSFFFLSLSLYLLLPFSPVPILFLSLWLSKCGEESAETGALLKELDCALGDRSDNEMVGGRKTHFLTCERERHTNVAIENSTE